MRKVSSASASKLEYPDILLFAIRGEHEAKVMYEMLAAADRGFELMVYPRTRHGIRRSQFALHFHRLQLDFLARHLLDRAED